MNEQQPKPWAPITDLPDDWQKLESSDLAGLAKIWRGHAVSLRESEGLRRFSERLSREWAIETGIIENLYTLDRGTTQLLIEHGIQTELIRSGDGDKPAELIASLVHDQADVLEGVFDFVKASRPLTTSYIKELHQAFTRHQPTVKGIDSTGRIVETKMLRGDWKRLPNNPSRPDDSIAHIYAPPEHTAAEMDRFVAMHAEHEQRGVPPEVEAAWLHHRFAQIHPFQDGNGRIARTLASMVFIKADLFPLVINRDTRAEYIDALEAADGGDLGALVSLFVRRQKQAFETALSQSAVVLRKQDMRRDVLSAISTKLVARKQQHLSELEAVYQVSASLQDTAFDTLNETGRRLSDMLREVDHRYAAYTEQSNADNSHWFRHEIVATAKGLNYFADTGAYRAWVRLVICEERVANLVLSFHSLGTTFTGVMAVAPFLVFRDFAEDKQLVFGEPVPLATSVFSFNYYELVSEVLKRFEDWLNEIVVLGLDQWRREL